MYSEDETRYGYIRDQIKSQIKKDAPDISENIDINIIPVAPDDMIVMNIKQSFSTAINFDQIHAIMQSIQAAYPNNKVIAVKDNAVEIGSASPSWVEGMIHQLVHNYAGDKNELLERITKNIKGEPMPIREDEEVPLGGTRC
jgi:hypothetical protein